MKVIFNFFKRIWKRIRRLYRRQIVYKRHARERAEAKAKRKKHLQAYLDDRDRYPNWVCKFCGFHCFKKVKYHRVETRKRALGRAKGKRCHGDFQLIRREG